MSDEWGNVNFYLLPFVRPSMVKNIVGTEADGTLCSYHETVKRLLEREEVNTRVRNVLVSHQFYLPDGIDAEQVERMDSEIRTVGNIDQVAADILQKFDYAALGHIHKPMKVGSEFYRYCGTPLACSVSEAGQNKGIVMVDIKQKGGITTEVLPLEPLRQIKVIKGDLKSVLAQSCRDYVTVILTDKVDLDVIDMQDRLRLAFPGLLEIRRETIRHADYTRHTSGERELNPFELCCQFLGNTDQEEQEILQDIINTVQEVTK